MYCAPTAVAVAHRRIYHQRDYVWPSISKLTTNDHQLLKLPGRFSCRCTVVPVVNVRLRVIFISSVLVHSTNSILQYPVLIGMTVPVEIYSTIVVTHSCLKSNFVVETVGSVLTSLVRWSSLTQTSFCWSKWSSANWLCLRQLSLTNRCSFG